MENLHIDPLFETETEESFRIDSDGKAEWAIRKVKEAYAERDRIVKCCSDMIAQYEAAITNAKTRAERDTAFLLSQLRSWFDASTPRATKTQATLAFPSGKLRLKFPAPVLVHDDEALMRSYPAFVEQRPVLRWGDLKKRLSISEDGQTVVDAETGEIVDGVTVETKPESFSIDF